MLAQFVPVPGSPVVGQSRPGVEQPRPLVLAAEACRWTRISRMHKKCDSLAIHWCAESGIRSAFARLGLSSRGLPWLVKRYASDCRRVPMPVSAPVNSRKPEQKIVGPIYLLRADSPNGQFELAFMLCRWTYCALAEAGGPSSELKAKIVKDGGVRRAQQDITVSAHTKPALNRCDQCETQFIGN